MFIRLRRTMAVICQSQTKIVNKFFFSQQSAIKTSFLFILIVALILFPSNFLLLFVIVLQNYCPKLKKQKPIDSSSYISSVASPKPPSTLIQNKFQLHVIVKTLQMVFHFHSFHFHMIIINGIFFGGIKLNTSRDVFHASYDGDDRAVFNLEIFQFYYILYRLTRYFASQQSVTIAHHSYMYKFDILIISDSIE